MNKKLTLLAMLLMSGIGLNAQEISVNAAKERAAEFLRTNISETSTKPSRLKRLKADNLSLAYTARLDKTTEFYVFNNREGGFVVTSAQEIAEPVLAFSEDGSFDFSTANPNLKFWLSEYQREIDAAIAAGVTANAPHVKTGHDSNVPILVPTRWDQDAPYNGMTPLSGSTHYLTGCVATAMSQVMKTHEWPVTGTGSHTYYDAPGSHKTISANFSEHTYDWANMKNKYNSSYTQVEGDAVALLMADAGAAVEMEYYSPSEGSGAYTEDCAYAFVTYFGYDQGVKHAYRGCYSDEDWDQMIYDELEAGRPVMYGGATTSGEGHSFICDGYLASTNSYHFNWGWGGSGDCYCRLSAVSGSGYNFKVYQDIVYGIQPPTEGTTVVPNIISDDAGNFTFNKTGNDEYFNYVVDFGKYKYGGATYHAQIFNDTWKPFDLIFSIKYTNKTTGNVYFAEQKDEELNKIHLDQCYPLLSYEDFMEELTVKSIKEPKMPAGSYRVNLVCKDYTYKDDNSEDLWFDILSNGGTNYGEIIIESNIDAPVVAPATDITQGSFDAHWSAIEDAETYTLKVVCTEKSQEPAQVLIDENFGKLAGESSDGTMAIVNFDQYMSTPGWTGANVFTSKNRLKLSSSKKIGTLASPLFQPASEVTVDFTEAIYGNDITSITVKIYDENMNELQQQKFDVYGLDHTATFSDIDVPFKVAFTTGEAKRCYISRIVITAGDMGATSTKYYENIADTTFTVAPVDLTTFDYIYYVKAVTPDGESRWSDGFKVTTSVEPLLGDVNADGEVNVSDISAIASYILGDEPTAFDFNMADINGDGEINVADVAAIVAVILNNAGASDE